MHIVDIIFEKKLFISDVTGMLIIVPDTYFGDIPYQRNVVNIPLLLPAGIKGRRREIASKQQVI